MERYKPAALFDGLAAFPLGMNSDAPPVLLPRTQLAFATNCTTRGAFVTHRPPYQEITLDTELAGLFQGACYYKPDSGPESIILSIAGRFYKVILAGTSGQVTDITPAETNLVDAPMAWLWQSELFMLINDGLSQTAIYNNVETTRALGDELVATLSSGGTLPDPGGSLAVTFTSVYTGPLNSPLYLFSGTQLLSTVEVNTENSTDGSYRARLTNVDDTPGNLIPDPVDIMILNQWSGAASQGAALSPTANHPPSGNGGIVTLGVNPPFTGSLNAVLIWPTVNCETVGSPFEALETWVRSISSGGSILTIERRDGNNAVAFIGIGNAVNTLGGSANVLVAITTEDFTVPAVGSFVDVRVDRQVNYNGQTVYINGKRYTIGPVPVTPTTTLYIKTINPYQPRALVAAGNTLRTIPQIPPGTIGVYGMGRNWIALPDRQSYIASDIVGGSSGSIAYDYRDSVLNVTENNYLAGGGTFRVPGAGQQINTMLFPAELDKSLGQGPLQVLTQNTVFSCNAPVDRLVWQEMTNPIQTQSMIGAGSLGEGAIVNGDIWFRAPNGVYSLRLARQDFLVSYANTPQSIEMDRVLIDDNRNLLAFFRANVFDNRLLYTASPEQRTNGVIHPNLIALNLDPNSGVGQKLPPRYDGVWTGLNILKLVSGEFNGVERSFAIVLDSDGVIGISEILTTRPGNNLDNGTTAIEWSFELPVVFNQGTQSNPSTRQLLTLMDGEIMVQDVVGEVSFAVFFRPDYDPEWRAWHSWTIPDSPTWRPRMGLGEPNADSDPNTGRPYRDGYHFQAKIVITGHCRFMGINFQAVTAPQAEFAGPMESAT